MLAPMICNLRQEPFSINAAIFPHMEKSSLQRRLDIAGKTQAELAELLGVSTFSASRLARGTRKMTATEKVLIDAWLNEPEIDIRALQNRIPLFGYAAGANGDRIAFTSNHALDWVDPPPYSTVSGEIAAIRILGESMEPRLFSGEEILIARGLYPARGKDAVVEFKDGTAVVKTYMRSKDGFIYCHQYNPDLEIKFRADDVKSVHAVIWRR